MNEYRGNDLIKKRGKWASTADETHAEIFDFLGLKYHKFHYATHFYPMVRFFNGKLQFISI